MFIKMHALLAAAAVSLITVLTSTSAQAVEVAGVRFDDTAQVAGNSLVLNGAGLRKKLFFKVYAMGLYVPQKSDSASAVLNIKGAKRVQIVTLRELTADQLTEALIEGLQKNHSKAELEKLNSRIESFRATMLATGKITEKTQIRLDYLPTSGTRLYLGTEQKGTDIPGEDFYQALLRIWLGDNPAQEDLRDELLGKP